MSFLARQEAKLPLGSRYDPLTYSDKGITITRGTQTQCEGNTVVLDDAATRHYHTTLFATNVPLSDGRFLFLSDLESGLFHEIGHQLDHLDSLVLKKSQEKYPLLDYITSEDSLLIAGAFREHLPITKGSQGRLGWLRLVGKTFFQNAAEVWQILGINAIENSKGEITLLLNKLSDFTLSCEMGTPIRIDHLENNREKIEGVTYQLPVAKYKALMEAHGYDLTSYMRLYYQKLKESQKTLADADSSTKKDSSDVEEKK